MFIFLSLLDCGLFGFVPLAYFFLEVRPSPKRRTFGYWWCRIFFIGWMCFLLPNQLWHSSY